MQTINFSHNWNNKLNCNCFTTIRLHNVSKYQVDTEYVVKQQERILTKTVKCIAIKTILLDELDEYTAMLDTGYSLAETKDILHKMYKFTDWRTRKLDIILCCFTKNNALQALNLFADKITKDLRQSLQNQ